MNKIVLEHYPASKLPDEVRGSIPRDALVDVTVEEVPAVTPAITMEELLRRTEEYQRTAPGVTIEEAVARIRELRDEWDD